MGTVRNLAEKVKAGPQTALLKLRQTVINQLGQRLEWGMAKETIQVILSESPSRALTGLICILLKRKDILFS